MYEGHVFRSKLRKKIRSTRAAWAFNKHLRSKSRRVAGGHTLIRKRYLHNKTPRRVREINFPKHKCVNRKRHITAPNTSSNYTSASEREANPTRCDYPFRHRATSRLSNKLRFQQLLTDASKPHYSDLSVFNWHRVVDATHEYRTKSSRSLPSRASKSLE